MKFNTPFSLAEKVELANKCSSLIARFFTIADSKLQNAVNEKMKVLTKNGDRTAKLRKLLEELTKDGDVAFSNEKNWTFWFYTSGGSVVLKIVYRDDKNPLQEAAIHEITILSGNFFDHTILSVTVYTPVFHSLQEVSEAIEEKKALVAQIEKVEERIPWYIKT